MFYKLFFFSFAAIGLVAGRATTMTRDQQFQELLRRQCKQYGAEDKVPELMVASKKFSDCISENTAVQDSVALQRTSDEDVSEAILGFVRQLCKKKSELEECHFNLLDALIPCTNPTGRDKLDVYKYALQNLGNYTCKNNAQVISDLFENGAVQCLEIKIYDIYECLNHVKFVNFGFFTIEVVCQKFSRLNNCIVNTLKQCPKPTLADFVTKSLDALVKGSICDNNNYYSISLRGANDA